MSNDFCDRVRAAFDFEAPPLFVEMVARALEAFGDDGDRQYSEWSKRFSMYPEGPWWGKVLGRDAVENWPFGAPIEYTPTFSLGVDYASFGFIRPAPELDRTDRGLFLYEPNLGGHFSLIGHDFELALVERADPYDERSEEEILGALEPFGIKPEIRDEERRIASVFDAHPDYEEVETNDGLLIHVPASTYDEATFSKFTGLTSATELASVTTELNQQGAFGTSLVLLRDRIHGVCIEDYDLQALSVLYGAMVPVYAGLGRDAYARRAEIVAKEVLE